MTAEAGLEPRGRPWLAASLAVIALVATGCGSADKSNEAESGPSEHSAMPSVSGATPVTAPQAPRSEGGTGDSACDIVSDDVVSEVLGIAIERREPHAAATGKGLSCVKGTERVTDLSQASYVSVSIIPGAGAMLLDQARAQAGSVPVRGLGYEALYLSGLGALLFADGADGVQIQVVKAGKPGEQRDAVAVAEDVVDRLG